MDLQTSNKHRDTIRKKLFRISEELQMEFKLFNNSDNDLNDIIITARVLNLPAMIIINTFCVDRNLNYLIMDQFGKIKIQIYE